MEKNTKPRAYNQKLSAKKRPKFTVQNRNWMPDSHWARQNIKLIKAYLHSLAPILIKCRTRKSNLLVNKEREKSHFLVPRESKNGNAPPLSAILKVK